MRPILAWPTSDEAVEVKLDARDMAPRPAGMLFSAPCGMPKSKALGAFAGFHGVGIAKEAKEPGEKRDETEPIAANGVPASNASSAPAPPNGRTVGKPAPVSIAEPNESASCVNDGSSGIDSSSCMGFRSSRMWIPRSTGTSVKSC